MSLSWITPKTDWDNTSKFTYTDYNRIRNNLLYINEKLNEMYPDVAQELDLGEPKTGYADRYYPSEFNGFENALESFKRTGLNVNIGDKKTFKGNDPFILFDELNRIEKCSLRWKEVEPAIQSVSIVPSQFSVGIGETIQLSINIVPDDIDYTVTWSCTDTSKATVDSNGQVTGVSGGDFTIIANITYQGKSVDATAVGSVIAGTVFAFNNSSYYYDFVYLGSNLDGNGLATVIGRYATDAFLGMWMSGSLNYVDAEASFRTSIQNFIDSNFTTQMSNALQNATKKAMVSSITEGIKAGDLTAKYFLLDAQEVGLYSPYIRPSLESPVVYSYLSGNSSRIKGDELSDTYHQILLRDRYFTSRSGGMSVNAVASIKDGSTIYEMGVGQNEFLRPLFFLKSNLMVKANANSDGSYSIDWTNTSGKPIGSLPVGTLIRDDSGSR